MVSVTDNDSAADLVLSPQSLVIDEGGEESFTVRLLNEPEGDVGITVTGYENTSLSVSIVRLHDSQRRTGMWRQL